MMSERLQRWIDELLETSGQQWCLRALAVLTPVGALLGAAVENGRLWPFGLIVVPMLAIASAVRPDTHTALVVIVMIVVYWVATVDDLTTAWLPVVSVLLLIFHTVTALLATIPIGGALPVGTLGRWSSRGAVVAAGTVAVWVLVVVLDRREAAGNGLLSGAALVVVTLVAVATRSRTPESQT